MSGISPWSCWVCWGENDGNEVSDLSEAAIDDAELEGCEVSFRDLDFARPVYPLLLLVEAEDSCDVLLSRGAACSGSISHHKSASRLCAFVVLSLV